MPKWGNLPANRVQSPQQLIVGGRMPEPVRNPRDAIRAVRAARVRAARAHADLDQTALGEALGKSVYTVKRLERGLRDVSDDELEVIARVTDVPVGFLIAGFGEAKYAQDPAEPLTIGVAEQFFRETVAALNARIDELEQLVRTREPEEIADAVRRALNAPADA